MPRFTQKREYYIPQQSEKVTRSGINAEVYLYTASNGKPAAAMFGGKRSKPDKDYYYGSETRRQEAIDSFFDQAKMRQEVRQAEKASRKPSEQAQVAKLCREYMKAKGIKGRATSEGYSMGDSVDVKVENQSPEVIEDLKNEFSQYQYGHFNGMEDIYEYSNRRDDIPQTKFLFIENHFTETMYQAAWSFLRNYFSGGDQLPECYEDAKNQRFHDAWVQDQVYRLLSGSQDKISNEFWSEYS